MNNPQPNPSLDRSGRRPVSSLCGLVVLAAMGVGGPAAPQGTQGACPPQPPVSLRISEGSAGWTVAVETPPDKAYTDILIGLDGAPPTSTGHDRALDVYTGKPQARGWRILPAGVPVGQHRVEARLVRRDGTVDGPHIFVFDRAAERLADAKKTLAQLADQVLSFSEHGDEVTWIGFGLFFDYRDSLREIRYSIDSCSLDERVFFAADAAAEPVAEGRRLPNDLILDRPFLTLPKATTRSACAQVVFSDGTLTQVFEAHRPQQPPRRFDSTEPEPEPAPTPCACLPDPVLPVMLVAREWDGEWTLVFRTPECPPVAELRVRIDDGKPTSLGHGGRLDSRSERLEAVHEMVFPGQGDPDVDRRLQVELVRPDGRVDGPYALLFSPREERLAAAKETIARSPYTFVSFAEHGSDRTWLGFHTLFALARTLREVRYSIDDCSLGRRLLFDGGLPIADPAVAPGDLTTDRPFLTLPRDSTRSACVQVVFADGSTSEILEIVREPRYRVRRN